MRRLAFLFLIPLLAGCGGDSEETAASSSSNTPTATLEASPSETTAIPTTGAEPNVGDAALRVGQWREGLYQRTQLAEIRFPYPPGEYREPQAGNQFVGLRIEQCVRDSWNANAKAELGGDLYSSYNGEWYAATPSGEQITSSSSWNDWPRPKFPETVTMNAGECVKGWVTVEVPQGTRIEKMIWRPGGETVGEWLP